MAEVKYEIIKSGSTKILLREFHGKVQADDVVESFKYIFEKYIDEDFSGIVSDFSHAKFAMGISDFQKVLKYIKRTPAIYNFQLAIVVNTPQKTIFPIIAKTKLKRLNIKPFSTLSAALDWLD